MFHTVQMVFLTCSVFSFLILGISCHYIFILIEINCCQYEIGVLLGKGGFGPVYEGTCVNNNRKVSFLFVISVLISYLNLVNSLLYVHC